MAIARSTALKHLAKLAGIWHTTGLMLSGPAEGGRFKGTDKYVWNNNKTFLIHTWKVRLPDGLKAGIEFLGFDSEKGIFAHAYDEDGIFTPSSLSFSRGKFNIHGPELSFQGVISKDGQFLSGYWLTTKGSLPVMQVELRRQAKS